jgi:hypothetical protein
MLRLPPTLLSLGLLSALAAGASGCSRADAGDPDVTRTDSAGVRIVSSGSVDRVLPWTFERIDVLRHSSVLADRGGRVYVLQRDPVVLRFSREGRHERSLGRKGDGPGEMQLPISLSSQGDTLVVQDLVRQVLVRWAPSLDPTADLRLEGALARAERIAFRTGGLWMIERTFSDSGSGVVLRGDTIAGNAPLLSIARPKGIAANFGCVSFSGMDPRFVPGLTWSANGPRLLANVGPGYELWLYEGARALASVRRSVPLRAPTVEDVRALYPDGMQVQFPGSDSRTCKVPVEDVLAKLGTAPYFPQVHDLLLLRDGTFWVQRTIRSAGEQVLDVFASDGAYAGTIRGMQLPVALLPNGELLVPVEDEDTGGTHIARMRVKK